MVGITLSPEQIRSAPPEVRQWLEHEIAASLGFRPRPDSSMEPRQLAACTFEEAEAVYASIRGTLPVVNVFFELGREGASIGQDGVEAFALADMLRHTRLPGMEQLVACLEFIDRTFREVRNDAEAALLVIDPRGYCLIAPQTQQSILGVWAQVIAGQQIARPGIVSDRARPAPVPDASRPFVTSGTVPPSSVHMNEGFQGSDGASGDRSSDAKVQW
jgi:hypothetical protein